MSKEDLSKTIKTCFYSLAAGVYGQIMKKYLVCDENAKIDKAFLFISAFAMVAGISIYFMMYQKYVKNLRPSLVVPVERWFTVNPILSFSIIIAFILALISFCIALWPMYRFYGVIFGIINAFVFQKIASVAPF